MTKIIPENKARQGHRGSHVLLILIAALILALIAWAFAEFYGEQIDPPQSDAAAMSDTIGHPLRG